jgi:beta-lactamase superfamily II metal-dependent hydrolase
MLFFLYCFVFPSLSRLITYVKELIVVMETKMSLVKSLSVADGDMFYIQHGSDNYSIIDCNIIDEREDEIIKEIKEASKEKNVIRFISTHPDEDHMYGLDVLDNSMNFLNFYCVKNKAIKDEETSAFKRYCKLRDSEKAFYLYKGCSRKWMNQKDETRGSAGINIHWPILDNEHYKEALSQAEDGQSPNNICPIISYSFGNMKFLWLGDLDSDFTELIMDHIDINNVTVLFAPHHGRKSGRLCNDLLKQFNPKIVIIGEAPADDIHYYSGYNTITQNSAGDISFDCNDDGIDIYESNYDYSVDYLEDRQKDKFKYYIGSLSSE